MTEVVCLHRGDIRLGLRRPLAHAVRVLACEALHSLRRATVRVALAQNRVNGRTLHRVVAGLRIALLIGLRLRGVIRQVVAGLLQFRDGGLQLRDGCRDVRQLDDVRIWGFGQFAELCQGIVHLLLRRQHVGKRGQDAGGQRDIAGFHLHSRGRSKSLHNWLQ